MITILIIVLLLSTLDTVTWHKLNPITEEYSSTIDIYENMSNNIKMKDAILSKNKELKNEISNLNFDADVLQEDIMSLLYIHSKKNNLEINKIIFSEASSVIDENNDVSIIDTNITFIQANVNFKCSFANMLKFIEDIKGGNKYVSITNLYLLSWNEEVLDGTIDLCFYSIPE